MMVFWYNLHTGEVHEGEQSDCWARDGGSLGWADNPMEQVSLNYPSQRYTFKHLSSPQDQAMLNLFSAVCFLYGRILYDHLKVR